MQYGDLTKCSVVRLLDCITHSISTLICGSPHFESTHHAIASGDLVPITLLVHSLARDVYQQRSRDQGRTGACTEVSAVRIILILATSPRGVCSGCALLSLQSASISVAKAVY